MNNDTGKERRKEKNRTRDKPEVKLDNLPHLGEKNPGVSASIPKEPLCGGVRRDGDLRLGAGRGADPLIC